MRQALSIELSPPRLRNSQALLRAFQIVLAVAITANGVLVTRHYDFVSWGVDAVLLMFAPAIAALLIFRHNPLDYGLRIGDRKRGIAYTTAGVLLSIIVVRISLVLFPEIGEFYGNRSMTLARIGDTLLYMFCWEFLIRGYVFHSFKREFSFQRANVGQATVFSIAHIGKPLIELATTPLSGMLFGLITHRARSVYPMVIIHTAIQLSAY